MRRTSLLNLYVGGLYFVLAAIVLHAPFSVALGSVFPDTSFFLKSWKELLLSLLAVIAIILLTRRRLWSTFFRSWLVQLAFGFITLHLLLIIVFGGDVRSVTAGLLIDLRFVAMFLLAYVAALLSPTFLPNALRAVAIGATVVIGFGLLQITVLPDGFLRGLGYSSSTITPFTTIDSNPDYVRINSTLRGPNPLGAMTVIYGALAASYFVYRARRNSLRQRYGAVVVGLASFAVLFASYSRSAYVAFAVAVVTALSVGRRFSKKVLFIAAGGVIVLGMGGLLLSETDWYSNVVLHEDPESTVQSKSNDEHITSLGTGAQRMFAQPLGAGIGSTGSASLYDDSPSNDIIIENYYFFVAHESGWLGLGVFVALFVACLVSLWRRRRNWIAIGLFASGIGLATIGILLPVWADETVALTWWGLVGATVASTSGIIKSNESRTRK